MLLEEVGAGPGAAGAGVLDEVMWRLSVRCAVGVLLQEEAADAETRCVACVLCVLSVLSRAVRCRSLLTVGETISPRRGRRHGLHELHEEPLLLRRHSNQL